MKRHSYFTDAVYGFLSGWDGRLLTVLYITFSAGAIVSFLSNKTTLGILFAILAICLGYTAYVLKTVADTSSKLWGIVTRSLMEVLRKKH